MIYEDLEREFMELVEECHQETGMMSLVSEITKHQAYQRIIDMGELVIPLLLRELERESGHWFWALRVITGTNPVKEEQRGKFKEMAEAWMNWAREQGYKW